MNENEPLPTAEETEAMRANLVAEIAALKEANKQCPSTIGSQLETAMERFLELTDMIDQMDDIDTSEFFEINKELKMLTQYIVDLTTSFEAERARRGQMGDVPGASFMVPGNETIN